MVKYKGEKHAYLFKPGGGIGRASYCGPGTNLKERLAAGDKPISPSDAICQQHDIAYSEAKDTRDIRAADQLMILRLEKAKDVPWIEKKVMGGLISSKIRLEQMGLIGPEFFTDMPGLHEPKLKGWAKYKAQNKATSKKSANLKAYQNEQAKEMAKDWKVLKKRITKDVNKSVNKKKLHV